MSSWTAEKQRAKYLARKLAGLCVRCGAGLTEDEGVQCVFCYQREIKRPRSIELRRKSRRRYYATHRELELAKVRARREALKVAGLCVQCGQTAADDSVLCVRHRDSERIRIRESARRRREKARAA